MRSLPRFFDSIILSSLKRFSSILAVLSLFQIAQSKIDLAFLNLPFIDFNPKFQLKFQLRRLEFLFCVVESFHCQSSCDTADKQFVRAPETGCLGHQTSLYGGNKKDFGMDHHRCIWISLSTNTNFTIDGIRDCLWEVSWHKSLYSDYLKVLRSLESMQWCLHFRSYICASDR